METGTLKELNVKPGDLVVSAEQEPSFFFKAGNVYKIEDGMKIEHDQGGLWNTSSVSHSFQVLSRAAQATPDLTAITTPFGLLDEATQEALRAHGGPYECYGGAGWWLMRYEPIWAPFETYRVKPGPIIETETMKITNADGMHMIYATVETHNGKPQWATMKVEAR